MTLLTPLGLIGLLSIVALIIIYIIKPNFQQKHISSTYVWKLSLKYKKRKLVTNRFRDILIIVCQVLILTSGAVILSQPNLLVKKISNQTEVIAIIDSSASMRTESDGQSRFLRAVNGVISLTDDTFDKNGLVSVIVANDKPYFLAERSTPEYRIDVNNALQEFKDDNKCSYSHSDINTALSLCEDIIDANANTKIYLYTDNDYDYVPPTINLVKISDESEWNASILNAYTEIDENFYNVQADVACFGRNVEVEVMIEIYGANAYEGSPTDYTYTTMVTCAEDKTVHVVFKNTDVGSEIYENDYLVLCPIEQIGTFESIRISIDEDDSFGEDNSFFIYGGTKPDVKVEYTSSLPNSFVSGFFNVLRNKYEWRYNIDYIETKKGGDPALKDMDLYVFEHEMPEKLPTDGVVILIDPQSAPIGSGIRLGSEVEFYHQTPLIEGESHDITRNIKAEKITLTKYTRIVYQDAGYQTLMLCENSPVVLVKDEGNVKIAVIAFDLHYSNLPIIAEFPQLMKNIFDYFFPETVKGNSFEVGENVDIRAKGETITVTGATSQIIDSTPASVIFDIPGTYELEQTTYFGGELDEFIYVRIPETESNIFGNDGALNNPYTSRYNKNFYKDLILYIAITLTALLMLEAWLHSREQR